MNVAFSGRPMNVPVIGCVAFRIANVCPSVGVNPGVTASVAPPRFAGRVTLRPSKAGPAVAPLRSIASKPPAPNDRLPVCSVPTGAPGASVPFTVTEPFRVPVPARIAPGATVTGLAAVIDPLTISAPALTVHGVFVVVDEVTVHALDP